MKSLIIETANFANYCHTGQLRKYTNRPYIEHPGRVAARMSRHSKATEILVSACWLHDTIEDCNISYEDLKQRFGKEVADLVSELTNVSKTDPVIFNLSRRKRKFYDLEHIKTISPEAKMIKMIDRMDNLSELPINNTGAIDFMKSVYYDESCNVYLATRSADQELAKEFWERLREVSILFNLPTLIEEPGNECSYH